MSSTASSSEAYKPKAKVLAENLEIPELDNRKYRVIQLHNGLEALLVCDPDTDKASAAMDVRVGSFADSEDLPGQAHAVEHLLFMGTEKYPAENEYSQFLSESGGYSNAYTASTETNYYFECSKLHLQGALDRFAQFFIAPLFREDCLDRELKAVDSENKKNLQNDSWRLYQLSKGLSNPKHPYTKFSTGNLKTLKEEPSKRGIDVRKEFIKFHGEHYSANVMKLVVVGTEELDIQQRWVEEMFQGVKNKNLEPPSYPGDVLTDKELLTIITAKPVMETRSIEITFPFFPEDEHYETHPSRYCAHLIGHEGPGSVLAYLKAKGLANGLSAGATPVCDSSAFFSVDIRLTSEGMEKWKDVVKIVFQYINMIRDLAPQEWVVEELQQVAAIDFRFRQKEPASRFTSHMSSVMQRPYPRDWLLSAGTLIRRFDPVIIRKALDCLRPDNFRLFITAQNPPADIGELDQVEKWYGTEYRVDRIPESFLSEIRALYGKNAKRIPELHMPHKNLFIPTDFTVEKKEVKVPAKAPLLLRNTDEMRVWHKKDDTFWVPKAAVFVTLRNPLVYASPVNYIRSKIYLDLVRDALSEYAYDAEISGLDYGLICHLQGIDIEVAGYNHKLPVLLEKVVTIMRDLDLKEDRFQITKERMLRGVRNWELIQPYKQISEHIRFLNFQTYWMNNDLKSELEILTLDDVRRFKPDLFQQTHIEMLVHGNLYKEDALKLSDLVHGILKPRALPPAQFLSRRTVIPPVGGKFCYPRLLKDPKNVNSCVEYFLYVSETTDRRMRCLMSLFAQIAEEPSFDQLRTKEQLGYIVWSGTRFFVSTSGFRVLIQSERSVSYVEHRIEDFLANFGAHIEKLTAKEFSSHIDSLVSKWTEKPKHLMQESNQLWSYIENENFDFTRTDIEVEILRTLTKDDLLEFYKDYIHPEGRSRSQVSVHLAAAAPTEASKKEPVPLSEQKTLISQAISQVLGPHSVEIDAGRLEAITLDQVEAINRETILPRVKALIEDVLVDEKQRTACFEQASAAVDKLLPKPGAEQDVSDEVLYKFGRPEVIEDPIGWKKGLRISAATRPVKPLVEYEETNVKL